MSKDSFHLETKDENFGDDEIQGYSDIRANIGKIKAGIKITKEKNEIKRKSMKRKERAPLSFPPFLCLSLRRCL